jgi:hypothetical protein
MSRIEELAKEAKEIYETEGGTKSYWDKMEKIKESMEKEVGTKLDLPGIGGTEFILSFGSNTGTFIVGEDIEIIDPPTSKDEGYFWTFKCLSQRAKEFFKYLNTPL